MIVTTCLGIAQSLTGKRIFITGATGFLGRVLVEKLLWSAPEVGKLLLLIRADRERGAEERLRSPCFRLLSSAAGRRGGSGRGFGRRGWLPPVNSIWPRSSRSSTSPAGASGLPTRTPSGH